ncbi:hypothetical protein, partial [Parafilimonas sp.]|uniref:hypothetical protein n=1 Tax=Parafilimonas sp. TaxID=1969739 RepID=UPI0039E5C328
MYGDEVIKKAQAFTSHKLASCAANWPGNLSGHRQFYIIPFILYPPKSRLPRIAAGLLCSKIGLILVKRSMRKGSGNLLKYLSRVPDPRRLQGQRH